MRTKTILLMLAAFGLIGTGAAFGEGEETEESEQTETEEQTDDVSTQETDEGEPAAKQAAMERRDALLAARHASLASFHENRTAILEEYRAALTANRESFLENKTAIIAACHEEKDDAEDNMTRAHCVRDGLLPLIEETREANKDARQHALERMKESRTNAIASFQQARADADARAHSASGGKGNAGGPPEGTPKKG